LNIIEHIKAARGDGGDGEEGEEGASKKKSIF